MAGLTGVSGHGWHYDQTLGRVGRLSDISDQSEPPAEPPTATMRFGVPPPDAAEQVTLQTRWGDPDVPMPGEYKRFFPYGMAVSILGEFFTVRSLTTGANVSGDGGNIAGARTMCSHPDSGLPQNGMDTICYYNSSKTHDSVNNLTVTIEALSSMRVVAGLEGNLDNEWYELSDAAATPEALDTQLGLLLPYYDTHPSVLGYITKDDGVSDQHGRRASSLFERVPQLDIAGRPATATLQTATAMAAVDPDVWQLQIHYVYPCSFKMDLTPTMEGDFSAPGKNLGVPFDWSAWIRATRSQAGPNTLSWMFLQAHQTTPGGVATNASQLRYPTKREIRMQVWKALGEGIKGFFWFAYNDQSPNWIGLAHPDSRDRMDGVAEMGRRLSPGIRARLMTTDRYEDKQVFTATGGGSDPGWLFSFANAYCSTLYDPGNDLYYCVIANNSYSTESITISSATLSGTIINMETGMATELGTPVSREGLDGGVWRFVPDSGEVDPLTATMLAASDNIVTGMRWMRDNGLARTGVAGNGSYEYDVVLNTTAVRSSSTPVDDEDGNYGEAHKLHGLCLHYLRTHDANLIPDIEAQVQWHIDIEQRLVSQRGSYWVGSAPYWIWPLATASTAKAGEGFGDPSINGGAGTSIAYNQGDVRVKSSIDQAHMVGHAMYAYLYLLRNEPAITANTTLWNDALAYVDRMATWELTNSTYSSPTSSQAIANLNRVVQGLTPLVNNGINTGDFDPVTWRGQQFGTWQLSGTVATINPSSNITIDNFMKAVYAPDSDVPGVTTYLKGMAMDMLASDVGQHDTDWHSNYSPPVLPYPTGWALRAGAGDKFQYASPRTIASNNGYSTDLHYIWISDSAARDGLSGRGAQRLIVLCLLALLDPTYDVPTELNVDGTVKRSVNIVTACNQWAETMAEHLPEPTITNCVRFMAPMHLGVTGSHPTNVIDAAFTGYWAMAVELWHLVNNGADIADYYPIGLW